MIQPSTSSTAAKARKITLTRRDAAPVRGRVGVDVLALLGVAAAAPEHVEPRRTGPTSDQGAARPASGRTGAPAPSVEAAAVTSERAERHERRPARARPGPGRARAAASGTPRSAPDRWRRPALRGGHQETRPISAMMALILVCSAVEVVGELLAGLEGVDPAVLGHRVLPRLRVVHLGHQVGQRLLVGVVEAAGAPRSRASWRARRPGRPP